MKITLLLSALFLSACQSKKIQNCFDAQWSNLQQKCVKNQEWQVLTPNGESFYFLSLGDKAELIQMATKKYFLFDSVKGGYIESSGEMRILWRNNQWKIIK